MSIIDNLNEEQKKAVLQKDGYILVLAGAGSGKTRVLTARVAHLIEQGVSPYNILAITFTNKAASEMKERISNIVYNADVWTSTFHSFCAKILRMEIDALGYSKAFTIYTEVEATRTIKRIFKNKFPNLDPKIVPTYRWHISRAKNVGMSPEDYYAETKRDFNEAESVFQVFRSYQSELKNSNALDFDDLLCKTVELFEKFPEVLEKYQNRFQYINVDEFQDTNYLQFELVDMLSKKHKNLFVVGDEDQSIYSWRGAMISNILDFGKTYPTANVFKLEQNYRSTPQILDMSNRVIANNKERNTKKLWTDNPNGYEVGFYEAYSERDEAEYVVRTIKRICSDDINYRDCAVLVRQNALTRVFEENFNMYSIPYKIFGGFRFFERKEIKDLLSYLNFAINPQNNDAFLRAVSYPKRGIGEMALNQLLALTDEYHRDLFYALQQVENSSMSKAVKTKFLAFKSMLDSMIEQSTEMKGDKFIDYVLEISGLRNFLSNGKDEDKNRLENMEELKSAYVAFEKDNPKATIAEFLESVALVADTDEMDDGNYVTIATVHAVKGLEFDNVFVVGLEDGIFPTKRSVDSCEIEEERRLMYVALTRARKKLTVSWAKSRFRFGRTEYMPMSRFINEMKGEKRRTPTVNNNESSNQVYTMKFGVGKSSALDTKPTQTTKKASNSNVNFDKFALNKTVKHKKYGLGKIVSVSGVGEDKVCGIAFDGLGIKKFKLLIAINSLSIVD